MSKELKTGIIAILIVVAFIWGYNFLKGHDVFSPSAREFIVEYNNVGGLTEASLVTINGLKVGQVEDINFNQNPNKKGKLVVRFSLENDIEFSKKSIVKIYSPNPLSGSNLAIIPSYEGELAVTLDTLQGEIKAGLLTSIGERLDPLQTKLEKVIVRADTLFSGINKVLNNETITGINSSVTNLAATIYELRQAVKSVNYMVSDNKENIKITLENAKNITGNLNKLSDSLTTVNFNQIVQKAENAVDNFNELSIKINSTDGTIGRLINDDDLYQNMEAASKELEQLLRDLKTNPKRYVHFSLFGKKPKEYVPTPPDSLLFVKE